MPVLGSWLANDFNELVNKSNHHTQPCTVFQSVSMMSFGHACRAVRSVAVAASVSETSIRHCFHRRRYWPGRRSTSTRWSAPCTNRRSLGLKTTHT